MKLLLSAVLYTALTVFANPALAEGVDTATLEGLREGSMKKLVFHPEGKEISDVVFTDPDGTEYRFSDYDGKVLLVNFWATWCAPCRAEMPMLDALQAEFGGEDFQVLTIATGRNQLPAITRFFDEVGVTNLPILLDPKSQLARDMLVMALPVSVLVDHEGTEIARMMGDAEWDSDSAKAIIATMIDAADD